MIKIGGDNIVKVLAGDKEVTRAFFGNSGAVYYKLPDNYQQVEYLESSGTQYIITNYIPNKDTEFEIRGIQGDSDCALFGLSDYLYCFSNNSDNIFYSLMGNGSISDMNIRSIDCVIKMSNAQGLVINGNILTTLPTPWSAPINYTCALFGRRDRSTGVVSKLGNHKIYYCKIGEKGKLLHYYIPCKRKSDDEPGVYDVITGTFFTNSGSGSFTPGPDVN